LHYVKSLEDFFLACKLKEEKNLECIKQNPRKITNSQEFHKLKAITIATKVTKEKMRLHNSILGLQRPLKFHTRVSSQPFNHQFENFMTNEKLAIQTSETCHMTFFLQLSKCINFYLEKKK
jgi:ribosomal protein L24E